MTQSPCRSVQRVIAHVRGHLETFDWYPLGSFSMPQSDFALIARLKETAKRNGQSFKKNELLRAGLRVLSAMPEGDLLATLAAVKSAKAHPDSR